MKVSIIGNGRVGSATAFALTARGQTESLTLVGRDISRLMGDVYDLQHASTFIRPMKITGGGIEAAAGSHVIIVTSSATTASNVSKNRLDDAAANAELFKDMIPKLAGGSPEAIFVVVTNPVDVMTYLTLRDSGFPPQRVIGTGTLIDTGRFRQILSDLWQINGTDVRAYILGEHGDSQFPALSVASAGGVRFDESDQTVLDAAEAARAGGFRVVESKGYTNYAIAMACALIVEAIGANTHSVLPVSTLIDGYLGVRDVCMSVPAVVGREGIIRTLPVDLNAQEAELFRHSAGVLRKVIDLVVARTE